MFRSSHEKLRSGAQHPTDEQGPVGVDELGAWEYSSCDSQTDEEATEERLPAACQEWPAKCEEWSAAAENVPPQEGQPLRLDAPGFQAAPALPGPQMGSAGANLMAVRPADLMQALQASKATQASLQQAEWAPDARQVPRLNKCPVRAGSSHCLPLFSCCNCNLHRAIMQPLSYIIYMLQNGQEAERFCW